MTVAAIRESVLAYLKKRFRSGWWVSFPGTAMMSGVPDVIGTAPELGGKLIGIELKTKTGRTSKLQEWNINRIRTAGGIAGVVRNPSDLTAMLKEESDARRGAAEGT